MRTIQTDVELLHQKTSPQESDVSINSADTLSIQSYCNNYEANFLKTFKNTTLFHNKTSVTQAVWLSHSLEALRQAKINGRSVFFIGNGASCSMASHFATDLTKNGKMSAHSLNEGALLTCFANDFSFETMYENIIRYKMTDNDILVAISSSGCSRNIVGATQYVRKNYPNATVLTFSGFAKDNPLLSLGQLNLWAPYCDYGIVESVHAYFLQLLMDAFMIYEQQILSQELES